MLKPLTRTALFGLFALFAASAQAGLIDPAPGSRPSQNLSGVDILPSVTTSIDNQTRTLTLIGDGLRSKKVAIATVKVYVAQVFAEKAEAFVRDADKALDSFGSTGTTAIRMTFLRNVDAQTVLNSFRENFFANKIDVTKTEIASFLDAVNNGGDATNNSSMTIRGRVLADGSEEIAYEGSRGSVKTVNGPKGFVKEIFSLWYGNTADSGLANLKTALLAKP
ncbi:MAG: hypothetical protein EBX52_02930 [Proteobacteria bacterium]|nr:hypothetical protein [Pseudomonadota bacterium]